MAKNKKGLSEILSLVLLLALTVILVGIVWSIVNNLVEDSLSQAGSCFETFGKVTINNELTCYDTTSNELRFSINVGDIELTSALVAVSFGGSSESFELTPIPTNIDNLVTYPDRETLISLPLKNAGLTYIFVLGDAGISEVPTSIRVAPKVGNNQCEVSDSIEQIANCAILVP